MEHFFDGEDWGDWEGRVAEGREEIRPLDVEDEGEDAGEDWGGDGIETIDLSIAAIGEIEIREVGRDAAGIAGSDDRNGEEVESDELDLDLLMGWGEESGDFEKFFNSLWRM